MILKKHKCFSLFFILLIAYSNIFTEINEKFISQEELSDIHEEFTHEEKLCEIETGSETRSVSIKKTCR